MLILKCLLAILPFIQIPDIETGKMVVPLPDSFENQILEEIGHPTRPAKEWKEAIRAKGYRITHSEVQHDWVCFDGFAEVEKWLESSLTQRETDQFIAILKERGWVDMGDGKIRFPTKRLILIVEF